MIEPKNRCWNSASKNPVDSTQGLIDLCQDFITKEMIGVEIGSFAGISSEVFSYFCKSLTCIDPWDLAFERENYREIIVNKLMSAEKEFDYLVGKSSNITKLKGFSNLECEKFKNESLDFVYIDGNHSNDSVKDDIICWMPKVKKNGILSGHDYGLICRVFVDLNLKVDKVFSDSSWVIKLSDSTIVPTSTPYPSCESLNSNLEIAKKEKEILTKNLLQNMKLSKNTNSDEVDDITKKINEIQEKIRQQDLQIDKIIRQLSSAKCR